MKMLNDILLDKLYQYLIKQDVLTQYIGQRIYFNLPAQPVLPCISIQIHTQMATYENYGVVCTVNFNLNILSNSHLFVLPVKLDQIITQILDGQCIDLSNEYTANFQKINIPSETKAPNIFLTQSYKGVIFKAK